MWIRFLYAYKNHSFRNVNTFLICIQKPLIPYCEYVSYMHTKTTHSLLWIRFLYAYKNHSFRMWIRFLYAYKNHSFRNVNTFLICIKNHSFLIVNTFLICIQKPLIPYCEYVSYMHTKTTHSVLWIRFLYAYKNHSFRMWIRFLYAYKNHSFRNVNTFLICIQKPLIP